MSAAGESFLRVQLEQRNRRIVEMVKDRDSRLAFERKKRRSLQQYLELVLDMCERSPLVLGSALTAGARDAVRASKKPYRARKR